MTAIPPLCKGTEVCATLRDANGIVYLSFECRRLGPDVSIDGLDLITRKIDQRNALEARHCFLRARADELDRVDLSGDVTRCTARVTQADRMTGFSARLQL